MFQNLICSGCCQQLNQAGQVRDGGDYFADDRPQLECVETDEYNLQILMVIVKTTRRNSKFHKLS